MRCYWELVTAERGVIFYLSVFSSFIRLKEGTSESMSVYIVLDEFKKYKYRHKVG